MSSINGDKSRHQINRKRGVLRRAKIRELVAATKDRSTATGDQPKETSRRASPKSR
jgi:hypothetical protein